MTLNVVATPHLQGIISSSISNWYEHGVQLPKLETGGKNPGSYGQLPPVFEPKLIGLTGYARCGKDTVGAFLADAFEAKRVSFAEPIRNALRGMMGLTDEHFHGALKEVPIDWLGKSPRQMMQTLGTEWGRGLVNDKIWLLIADQNIQAYRDNYYHVVVTDVRFENEAEFIRSKGGVVWHVKRTAAIPVQKHASEAGIQFRPDLGDIVIDNNGSLQDLQDEVIDQF